MAGSEAFARIKRDVIDLTCQIPRGKIVTYSTIAGQLDVMPRHVAYILAMLDDQERSEIPWHRVVADGGVIRSTAKRDPALQRQLLMEEGIAFTRQGKVADFEAVQHTYKME